VKAIRRESRRAGARAPALLEETPGRPPDGQGFDERGTAVRAGVVSLEPELPDDCVELPPELPDEDAAGVAPRGWAVAPPAELPPRVNPRPGTNVGAGSASGTS
jgi:hypothetical protein